MTSQSLTEPRRLRTLLGNYPGTRALKKGELPSARVAFDFADADLPQNAFKRVVRDLEFDVAELAITTLLIAKAHGKPLVLLPAVVMGRPSHPFIAYNAERGVLTPGDLAGRRVGIRSYSVTTVMWVRGILENDYGVDLDRIKWITFEEPHVAEFRDPPNVERAPEGKEMTAMLLDGELDAAVLGAVSTDPRLKPLIPDPMAAARDWEARKRGAQINHMVAIKASLSKAEPDVVREVYRLLLESKKAAGLPAPGASDTTPFGVEANRRSLEAAIEYAHQQRLIPRRFAVDELFDDVTRTLGA